MNFEPTVKTPIPFDPVHGPALLTLLGYELTHHPADWEDVGDAENGPKLVGGPAYDEWEKGDRSLIVVDNQVVAYEVNPPNPYE